MDAEMEKWKKWLRVNELLFSVNDLLIGKFFDAESEELLDEKIEVLEALAAGVAPNDIPNYYKILERYPGNDQIWD